MKHWSEFISTKTNVTKRLGKIANTLSYEVQCKEIELQNVKSSLEKIELEICKKLAVYYNTEQEYGKTISNAREKAEIYNNELTSFRQLSKTTKKH